MKRRFTFLVVFLVGVLLLVACGDQKTSGTENKDRDTKEDEEQILKEKFPFYEDLPPKDELEEVVQGYYDEDPEVSLPTINENLSDEYGSINETAFSAGLLMDDEMSMQDKEQILIALGDKPEEEPIKMIINPVDHPNNNLEEENRHKYIQELEIIDDRFYGAEQLFVDTEGFINDAGFNLGYPLIDSYFYDSDEFIRGVDLAIYHYIDEDIPLEVDEVTGFLDRMINNFDVRINGHDLTEYLLDELEGELTDDPTAFAEEYVEEMKEESGENFLLREGSLFSIEIRLPLDLLVDVPPRQFPTDGEVHELFDLENEDIVIAIHGVEYSFGVDDEEISSTSINPEVIDVDE